ncbi:MAG: putative dsRNA-binding protein, partial [Proteobacteria bacterium]|nr:putative dsRNA-binding protein [Pseudomonadota bacterium]
ILSVIQCWLQNIDPNSSDKDAKTRLQEYLQGLGYMTPEYNLIKKQGKDHLQTFTIQCVVKELDLKALGNKRSRKKAEQLAAQNLLNMVNDDAL